MQNINDPNQVDDEQDRCRTAGCDGDPNNGDGWDGYCGNCADTQFPQDADCGRSRD